MFFFDTLTLSERGDVLSEDIVDSEAGSTTFTNANSDIDNEGTKVMRDKVEVEPVSAYDEVFPVRARNAIILEPSDVLIGEEILLRFNEHLMSLDIGHKEDDIGAVWFEALSFLTTRVYRF